jgi:hypothetical protein
MRVHVWLQAENERMHLLTFLQLSQPGVLFTQVCFTFVRLLALLLKAAFDFFSAAVSVQSSCLQSLFVFTFMLQPSLFLFPLSANVDAQC